jgi:hypothetical protein
MPQRIGEFNAQPTSPASQLSFTSSEVRLLADRSALQYSHADIACFLHCRHGEDPSQGGVTNKKPQDSEEPCVRFGELPGDPGGQSTTT